MTFSTLESSILHQALRSFRIGAPYYQCCLIVSTNIQRLEQAKEWIASQYLWIPCSIGRELSTYLQKQPAKKHAHIALITLEQLLNNTTDPLICSDIDLLFDPSLRLDPLKLLLEASRTKALTILWPGVYQRYLSYAVPTHAHYRIWKQIDIQPEHIVSL